MPMPTRLLGATVGLALTLTLTACGGDDEPDLIPGGTGTPTPAASVSPPPEDVPELNAEQQSAYDAAVARYAEFETFSNRVAADPEGTPLEFAAKVSDFTTKTGMQTWADSVDSLVEAGIRIEGERKIEWTVPVSVTDEKIILRRCESPGTWTAYQDGESTRESGNSVAKVTLVYSDDEWRFDAVGVDGKC